MADVWNLGEILETITLLEQLGIEYHLGGSVASSMYGERRRTHDVDIVALLQPSHIRCFIALLSQDYYLSESSIRDALRLRSSFNLIFFKTGFKIDIFIPKLRAFDQDELQHIHYVSFEEGGRVFPIASPEAMILRKLEWYEMGGRVSDRQRRDVIALFQKNADSLDYAYLDHWADILNVYDLFFEVIKDAGIS